MSESLDREIRTLQSIYGSERDTGGMAFASLADALRRRGNVREALDLLTQGTSRHPDYSTGHVVTAQLYLEQGLHAEAELAARRVLDLDPGNIVGLATLAVTLHARGSIEEADACRATLAELDPESDEANSLTALDLPRSEAPGDAPFDMVSLAAPSIAEEESLAPDHEDESSFPDALVLAPPAEDAAEAEEAVVELGALAPEPAEEEAVFDVGALAPEPAEEEAVFDMAALAPEPAEEEAVFDMAALAPEPAEEEAVFDMAALAPEPAGEPDDAVFDLGMLAPSPGTSEGDVDADEDAQRPIYTRTLAELYVRQGFKDRAVDVFRNLLKTEPGAEDIRRRLAELEGSAHDAAGQTRAPEAEDEVETLARDLSESGAHVHDVDTPFAWSGEDASHAAADDSESIADWFARLLEWGEHEEP